MVSLKSPCNCLISEDLKFRAINKGLGLSRCLEFGIMFKLAELGLNEHPESSLKDKIAKLAGRLEKALRELENERAAAGKVEDFEKCL